MPHIFSTFSVGSKPHKVMPEAIKLLKCIIMVLMIAMVTSCAPAKKNTYYQKRKKAHVSTEQLGRNRYYFSPGYQKKLNTTFKKKKDF